MVLVAILAPLGALLGLLLYGWLEAGSVRLRELHLLVPGLPAELDGLRIAHLSDFHLGVPSPGRRAVERGVAWAVAAQPDLTLVTGDLLSHRRGEARLRALMAELLRCYAVLGNHDIAAARDPFSKTSPVADLRGATLLNDNACVIRLRDQRIEIVGVHPSSYLAGAEPPPVGRADAQAALRILLCHYPDVVDRLPAGAFQLVLAGHMHNGQINLPTPFGMLHCAHPRARYTHGLYERPGGILHVSAGLGTTFVPFRFLARPEATMLVLDSPAARAPT